MIRKKIGFFCTVFLMFIIFCFSSMDQNQKIDFSKPLYSPFQSIAIEYKQEKSENSLDSASEKRINVKVATFFYKFGHFVLFLFLGLFSFIYADCCDLKLLKSISFAFLFCVIYALFDEFHQFFIDGRNAAFKDVLIDSFGAVVGILISYILNYKILKIKRC